MFLLRSRLECLRGFLRVGDRSLIDRLGNNPPGELVRRGAVGRNISDHHLLELVDTISDNASFGVGLKMRRLVRVTRVE
jgi:hypothetical protein